MKKLLFSKLNLAAADHLLKPRQKNQIFKVASRQSITIGSSLIELLLATALALFAVGTAAQIMNNLHNSGRNRQAGATGAIAVAISNDLAWFRQYAVLWRLQQGPFPALDIAVTKINYGPGTPNIYAPDVSTECNPSAATATNMASNFQVDASDAATYVAPINTPPNSVPSNNSSSPIALPAVASGYTMFRSIQPGSTLGTLAITYTLSKSGTILLKRSSLLYLPASGWCT